MSAPSNILTAAVEGGDLPALKPTRTHRAKPGIVFAPSLTCPRCDLLAATRRPVWMEDKKLYWQICPECEAEVKALPKAWTLAERLIIEAILRQYANECRLALPPGPIAAVMPVPQHEDEVAKQRHKRSKRNGHGQLIKRNRRAA